MGRRRHLGKISGQVDTSSNFTVKFLLLSRWMPPSRFCTRCNLRNMELPPELPIARTSHRGTGRVVSKTCEDLVVGGWGLGFSDNPLKSLCQVGLV